MQSPHCGKGECLTSRAKPTLRPSPPWGICLSGAYVRYARNTPSLSKIAIILHSFLAKWVRIIEWWVGIWCKCDVRWNGNELYTEQGTELRVGSFEATPFWRPVRCSGSYLPLFPDIFILSHNHLIIYSHFLFSLTEGQDKRRNAKDFVECRIGLDLGYYWSTNWNSEIAKWKVLGHYDPPYRAPQHLWIQYRLYRSSILEALNVFIKRFEVLFIELTWCP